MVALDPGHGGCLDWGVPDPLQRGIAFSEKTMTLAIASELRAILEAEGITVVMTRTDDSALAGDDYPDLDCNGPPWRDVNGDGELGFIPDDPEGAVRTRDELQARLDLANVARADMLISIHINSLTQDGVVFEIAATETFYTDETPWGAEGSATLAAAIQDGVVSELDALGDYERGDRGITAHNFYLVAPPLFEPTAERPDPVKQPTRGALMPTVLSEVGSITLREEHDLLASTEGQAAVATGLFDGLIDFFAEREHAVRIGLEGEAVPPAVRAVDGSGPPFWAPVVPEGALRLRVTNTGSDDLAAGSRLVAGWTTDAGPYLPAAPVLGPIGPDLPALAPGASVVVEVELPSPPSPGRAVAWISLTDGRTTLADLGSPALQVSTTARD